MAEQQLIIKISAFQINYTFFFMPT